MLHVLGRVAYFDGDHPRARALGEQSLTLAESLGDRWLLAWALHLLGLAAHIAGDLATADELYEQSMAIRRALGHREMVGVVCQLMGMSAHRRGDFLKARALYCEYLDVGRELRSTFHISNVLAQFGSLAASQGQAERAARLMGAAGVFHETSGTRPIPLTTALVADGMDLVLAALGEAAFKTTWAVGRALSSDEAIAEALAVDVLPGRPVERGPYRSQPASPARQLTQREQEVAALIAGGLTNRQIAAELVISGRTVAAHVEHILDKLGFVSRTQIGVWTSAAERTTVPRAN